MTDTKAEIERLVEQRKKEAEKKQINNKLVTIVAELGKDYYAAESYRHGTYSDKKFDIEHKYQFGDCDAGCWVDIDNTIKYENEIVYQTTGDYKLVKYLPGSWEKTLDELYSKAKIVGERKSKAEEKKEALQKRQEEQAEIKTLKENFGL